MSRMISRGKGHDPFRFPFARCPQRLGEIEPPGPVFGEDCLNVTNTLDAQTTLNEWQDFINYTAPSPIAAGWYIAGYTMFVQTEDGGIDDFIQVRMLVNGTPVASSEPEVLTDQDTDLNDPNINLALFGFVQLASPGAPVLRLQYRASPTNPVVKVTCGAMEMWRIG
jgi:hypothetical protein